MFLIIYTKVNKAYKIPGVIKRTFKHVDEMAFYADINCQLEVLSNITVQCGLLIYRWSKRTEKNIERGKQICKRMLIYDIW